MTKRDLGTKNILSSCLKWLPSLIITLFFIPNAVDKILQAGQTDKIITNPAFMMATGLFLVVSTALFLYNKTILIGTALLSGYMTLIVFIHIYKGKPYEVTLLIVMASIFASYIRAPQLFHQKVNL